MTVSGLRRRIGSETKMAVKTSQCILQPRTQVYFIYFSLLTTAKAYLHILACNRQINTKVMVIAPKVRFITYKLELVQSNYGLT